MANHANKVCDRCRAFDRCDEQYGYDTPPCAKLVEENLTDLQQLQAIIAALTFRLETYVRDACLEDKEVFDIADKMRQLSAMQ